MLAFFYDDRVVTTLNALHYVAIERHAARRAGATIIVFERHTGR